ncbi:MAG: efflux transporter outer membrane subunit [Phycisphaerales bacterium JB043]
MPAHLFGWMATLSLVLVKPLSLTGCKVGPDYEGPPDNIELPATFGQMGDPAFRAGEADLRTWWTVFNDPMLDELIHTAEADNRDLRIAVSKVTEARARVGIAQSARSPQISLGGGAAASSDSSTGFDTRVRTNLSAEASWEIDVFGRIARQVEAADATYEATEEDRRDVQVSLFAEVARAYLSVRSLQAQLAAAENNIGSQREILSLTETRFRDGISSGLDVAQAREVLASSEAQIPALRISLSREINTIALLVGTHPQALHVDLREPGPIPVPPQNVTVGLPADLLRQRPDIRAAERRLAAQTAQLGVATADLYPSFSLGGSIGLSALDGDDLLDASSRSFSFGPSLRWSVFDGGRVRAQIRVEDARVEQSILLYERAVLQALEEVESSMTAFLEQRVRVDATERAADAARETLRLATTLYKDGLVGFQDVLDAQRRVFSAEGDVAASRGLAAQYAVSLYKALGGGWDPAEVEGGQQPNTTP